MKKLMIVGLALALLFLPLAACAVTNAGNAVCPVSGDEVSGTDFVEYKGVKYGLCCSACTAAFNKDPEKYIAALAKQEEIHEDAGHSM